MKKSTDRHLEETVLRELFRTYDRDNNGIVTLDILSQLLAKADVATNEQYLQALLNTVQVNNRGEVEFEEFVAAIIGDRYTSK